MRLPLIFAIHNGEYPGGGSLCARSTRAMSEPTRDMRALLDLKAKPELMSFLLSANPGAVDAAPSKKAPIVVTRVVLKAPMALPLVGDSNKSGIAVTLIGVKSQI